MADTTTTTAPTSSLPVTGGTTYDYPDAYTDTVSNFSGFANDYLTSMMDPDTGVMSGYDQPRVADLNSIQTGAINEMGSALDMWQDPYLAGLDALNAGYTGVDTAQDRQFNVQGRVVPGATGALNDVNSYASSLSDLSSGIGESLGYDPNQVGTYLNPYLEGVISEIARLGNENLFENVMPGVNSTFVGSGQFGSVRNADFLNNAIRNNQREILGQQANALKSAWDSANQQYLDWSKLGLEGDIASGNMLTNAGNLGLGVAGGYNELGNTLTNINKAAGDLSSTMADIGIATGEYGQNGATNYLNMLKDIYGIGEQVRGIDQQVLDKNYEQWVQDWTMPLELFGGLTGNLQELFSRIQPNSYTYSSPELGDQNDLDYLLQLWDMMNKIDNPAT